MEFDRIRRYFSAQYRRWEKENLLYKPTRKGMWAFSLAEAVYAFMKELDIARCKLFVDLGSGDGLVSCIAGLFTRAIGIEIDPFLTEVAHRNTMELGLRRRVSFVVGDFTTMRLGVADCLYIYPDGPISERITVPDGWAGRLLVYGQHIIEDPWKPESRLRHGREILMVYRRNSIPF